MAADRAGAVRTLVAPPAPSPVHPSGTGAAAPAVEERVIRPARGWDGRAARELWEHRELVLFLALRDLRVRYKQTVLGVAWTVLQPLCLAAVFALFLGRVMRPAAGGVPYPLFCLVGLVPWSFFAHALSQAAGSLTANGSLVTKVYFPRLALPLSAVLAAAADLLVAAALLVTGLYLAGFEPTARILLLPPLLGVAAAAAAGAGMWLCALNLQYRDVRHVLPFLCQLWMLATPVAYPASLLAGRGATLAALNPMAGVVEGVRWSLLGTAAPPPVWLGLSVASALLLLASGLWYFLRTERSFADVI